MTDAPTPIAPQPTAHSFKWQPNLMGARKLKPKQRTAELKIDGKERFFLISGIRALPPERDQTQEQSMIRVMLAHYLMGDWEWTKLGAGLGTPERENAIETFKMSRASLDVLHETVKAIIARMAGTFGINLLDLKARLGWMLTGETVSGPSVLGIGPDEGEDEPEEEDDKPAAVIPMPAKPAVAQAPAAEPDASAIDLPF